MKIIQAILVTFCLCLIVLPPAVAADETGNGGMEVVPRADWGAATPIVSRMKLNPPKMISVTIHHTAAITKKGSNETARMKGIQHYHMNSKKWGDTAYHFLIGPSGKIYKGRDTKYVSDTATNYDPTGHFNICVMGNFEEQEPTPEIKKTLVRFVAESLVLNGLTPKDIHIHKDVAATLCPGKNLIKWLKSDGLAQIKTEYNNISETGTP